MVSSLLETLKEISEKDHISLLNSLCPNFINHLLNLNEHVAALYLGLLQYLQQAVEGTRRIRIPSNLIKKKIAWIHNYL